MPEDDFENQPTTTSSSGSQEISSRRIESTDDSPQHYLVPPVSSTNEQLLPALETDTNNTESDEDEEEEDDDSSSYGSSAFSAMFNFTNCIVGAGAIGLGGAFADSGGLISIVTIIFFAILTKLSLDLVVTLSVENSFTVTMTTIDGTTTTTTRSASYEELGYKAFGQMGRMTVLISKFLYSFGCMVADIIVVKDNFKPALQHLIFGDNNDHNNNNDSWFYQFLSRNGAEDTITWLLGSFVILPLCLLRDMTPLASLGAVSITSMGMIVLIVTYIFVTEPEIRNKGGSIHDHWFEVRPGYVESWGTFVFTFVSQHTVNLAFESLKPEIRTVQTWKRVSSWSLFVATFISLTVGTVVYMTFWETTQSDLFDMYPPMRVIDVAKMLLCFTMLLTFPLPFFSCRELLIVFIIRPLVVVGSDNAIPHVELNGQGDLAEPLLPNGEQDDDNPTTTDAQQLDSTSVIFEDPHERSNASVTTKICSCLSTGTENFSVFVPGEEKQLSTIFHVALSCAFWGVSTYLAIVSPNLGDILDLVGAASGTAMAFILPGLLSFKLQGCTSLALFIFVVGGAVGIIGTVCSMKKLIEDII